MRAMIPKEHGAWAVLYVPMLVAAGLAGGPTWNVLLLALSALGVFMSYVPMHMLLRHVMVIPLPREQLRGAVVWSVVYGAFGVVFIVPLLMQSYWLLLVLGIPGVAAYVLKFLLTRRSPKTVASDMVAVFGLSLSALCSWYVVTGVLDEQAVIVWMLNLLFFWCGVVYVHMKLRAAAAKVSGLSRSNAWSLAKLNVLYHLAVIMIVAALAWYRTSTLSLVIAFVPMTAHALYGTYKLTRRVAFRRLGFLLLAHSIVFAVLLWRTWQ